MGRKPAQQEETISEVNPEIELKNVQPVLKEVKKENVCPYCNLEDKAIDKVKTSNQVHKTTHGKWQCLTCGKHWDEQALGKPYSIELERGEHWAREMKARELKER